MPTGCAFRERCTHAGDACADAPGITAPLTDRAIRCHHPLLEEVA
jgi:peptide/nickel transport system ATP-binding protein